jgi:hypothetical protein
MDVLTLFVDQGALAGIRIGGEGIIVDAHMPECENVNPKEIQQSLAAYFKGVEVRGLILTGFDSDHAHDLGVEWILSTFQPAWIMYPKYYKPTDCATAVFNSINKHERRRATTARPLVRHSIRIDRMASRFVAGLGNNFTVELFSPHFEDMDSSNNCSIVAKITGRDATGFRYLATGDTEIDRWETISRIFGTQLAADVMAAPHHGSISGVYGPMVRAASYLDMYVLATDRPGRRQIQVFNRYDRCCYRNTKALLYLDAVREAVSAIDGGKFDVLIDETHTDHKISDQAMGLILADMALP